MKKNDTLISIIIPVYNVENYLEGCLESVTTQTYQNIEIILVDDGSTDSSLKICQQYAKNDNRIHVFHQKNKGLSSARNCGIKIATGTFLTFIDSDDDIKKDYIEYLFHLIQKYKSKMSICAYSVVTNSHIINIGEKYSEEVLTTQECLKRMLTETGFTVSACAKMYHKDLFKNIKFPINKLCEDNATTYKLIMQCDKIPYGNESKYNYYKRNNSIMTKSFSDKKLDLLDLTDIMCNDIQKKFPNLKQVTDYRKYHAHFSILRQMVNSELSDDMCIKKKEIVRYLKKQKKDILQNSNSKMKDKIALISLLINEQVFKFAWNLYEKMKG